MYAIKFDNNNTLFKDAQLSVEQLLIFTTCIYHFVSSGCRYLISDYTDCTTCNV